MYQNQGNFSAWKKIQQLYQNSVMQIITVHQIYSPLHPYSGGSDKYSSGSSFLIDKSNAIFATNAHVVYNASSLVGAIPKFGKMRIPLEVVSIIRDKDIALVRIEPKFAKEIMKHEDIREFSIGDDLMIEDTQDVLAIGYPHGERNIKYTSGIISGYHSDETGFLDHTSEDTYHREPTFITITAPLNPGMSGGPLVDSHGRVVAINSAGRIDSQNIGYSIGIRTLLSNYKNMLENQIPKLPTLNVRWNYLTEDTIDYLCKGKKVNLGDNGVLIRKVLPDSIFQGMQSKDILTHMVFSMISNFDRMDLDKMCKGKVNKMKVTAVVNNLGEINLFKGDLNNHKKKSAPEKVIDKPVVISRIIDMIEVDEPMEVYFLRDGQMMKLNTSFSHISSERVHGVYEHFEKLDWSIVAGMCFTPLLLNQMGALRKFNFLGENNMVDELFYTKSLVLTQVFPGTKASRVGFNVGDVLKKVNDIEVKTLEDLEKALKKKGTKYLTFEMDTGAFTAYSAKELKKDDELVAEYI